MSYLDNRYKLLQEKNKINETFNLFCFQILFILVLFPPSWLQSNPNFIITRQVQSANVVYYMEVKLNSLILICD